MHAFVGEKACGIGVPVELTVWFACVSVCVTDVLSCEGVALQQRLFLQHTCCRHWQKDQVASLQKTTGITAHFNYLSTCNRTIFSLSLIFFNFLLYFFLKAEQKPDVSLGQNILVVKKGECANNSHNTTPHRPLANMSTDTSCQHIYYHSHAILHVQASADRSLCV